MSSNLASKSVCKIKLRAKLTNHNMGCPKSNKKIICPRYNSTIISKTISIRVHRTISNSTQSTDFEQSIEEIISTF